MFKKIVSNLPFNPSLLENLPEYTTALRRQRFIRILGFLLIMVAFVVQLLATIFPAHPSLAYSPNDLITGGFSSPSEALRDCNNNLDDYKNILDAFDISCNDVYLAKTSTIHINGLNSKLFSINRVAYGQSDERQLTVDGQSYWIRDMEGGNGIKTSNLKVLSGVSSGGVKFTIPYDSADLVFSTYPVIAPFGCGASYCPSLYLSARNQVSGASDSNGTTVQPGDIIIYTLAANNASKQDINGYQLTANFGDALSYSSVANLYGGKLKNNQVSWPAVNLASGHTMARTVAFKVTSPISKTPLSSTDPYYFNSKMTTVFGNVITIDLPMSAPKFFELNINNSLPAVGPIIGLLISTLLVLYLGYFIARDSLLLRELDHLKDDYLNGHKD